MQQFDLIVIGAGPGGYVAAIKAAQLGMRTAIVEMQQLGGTCLNRGCIPTKALVHAASLYRQLQELPQFGLQAESISYDMAAMHLRKDEVVAQLAAGIESLLEANKIELIRGEAQITAAGCVRVNDENFNAKNIIIATGSRPVVPEFAGADLPGVLTSDQLLETPTDCHRLVIVGAGVVGMEFATIYSDLGAKVTVIELLERVLATTDREISQNLSMIMKKRGVDIHTMSRLSAIEQAGGGLVCHFSDKSGDRTVEADNVLLSMGRRGCIDGLFADNLGININHKTQQIVVDQSYQTSISGIYAIGDVVQGSIQLAHMASAEGICVASRLAGKELPINLGVAPSCIFTEPEIASVGMSEAEAKDQGITVKAGKYLMAGNGKSLIAKAERGFVKIVVDESNNRIIGAQLMCCHACDLLGELSLAIATGLSPEDISAVIHPHPTFGEGIVEAAQDVFGTAIHAKPRRR